MYLRNLENAGIFTSLEDITYDTLIRTTHQRSIAMAEQRASPEKELSTARDYNLDKHPSVSEAVFVLTPITYGSMRPIVRDP